MSPKRPKVVSVGALRASAIRSRKADERWYWQAITWHGGARTTVWSGWATRPEAVQALARLVADGVKPKPPPDTSPALILTVGDLLNRWVTDDIDPRADLSTHAVRNYTVGARRLLGKIGDVLVSEVDDDTLRTYRDRRGGAGSTLRRDIKVLRMAWAWGRARGLVPSRSLAMPPLSMEPVRNRRTPSDDEVAAVLAQLDPTGWAWHAVYLLWTTGCRIHELAQLSWTDVDLERGEIRVAGKRTRQNPSGDRVVPLGPEAMEVLVRWRTAVPGDSLWPTSTPGVVQVQLGHRHIRPACARARVPYFTPHGLRRCAEDRLADRGVDVAVYAALLGHSPLVALEHYRRPTRDSLRRSILKAGMGRLDQPTRRVVQFRRALTPGRLQGSPPAGDPTDEPEST